MPEWKDVVNYGQVVLLVFLILAFLRSMAPFVKAWKFREYEVREKEAAARQSQATSLSDLANVIQSVAVEQKRTSETNDELRIFLRAAMREHEGMARRLAEVEKSVEDIRSEARDGNKVH